MSWSWTLYRYLAVQYLIGVVLIYSIFLMLAFSIDIVDLLNRTANHNVPTSTAIGMAVLQLPNLGQKMLPFAILLGGVFTFVRLSRSRELVATRAAGVSAWDFLLPPLTVAVFIGVFTVTVFTPISARMFSQFAGLEARYVKGEESRLSLSMNGLWLRQGDASQQSVIHALRVARQGEHLENVMILLYGANDRFTGRIDAKSADLKENFWIINDAWVSDLRGIPVHHKQYRLGTTLTPEQIVESSTAPDALSFWDLPGYIRAATSAGFSANRYQLYLYTLYALPAVFAAMVFMAASFSLKLGREAGMAKVILFSAACGFGVYFFQNLTFVLGRSGAVPILLAATAPALASILIGMTLIFSHEDG